MDTQIRRIGGGSERDMANISGIRMGFSFDGWG